ncbi:uncharacterized protein BXZ73DRAFT_77100 [Epithele typhae]|uniref:uncharacterized protein n=1 Tax=Epithele typhae TaxID=378194 RepID=UPI00200747E9|nr:uncharacterized protein BXZ73DRAFT_77100 [Epithele typhae]KAH9933990.1 hypothetical protein BXZ73DRAFT_77100 [Epithele typhae]
MVLQLRARADTGAPPGSTDYTTLVLLHGFVWHSGTFARLLPLATSYNARVILVNRPGYPDAPQYTDEECALLKDVCALSDDPTTLADRHDKLLDFMKDRAREVYDFLGGLVIVGDVTPADKAQNKGGIVVGGWSCGAAWITALLAYMETFPIDAVDLSKHLRQVILHDPGMRVLGYPTDAVPDPYNPALLPFRPADDRAADALFARWVTGYFAHGPTLDGYERRTPLARPAPTIATISAADLAAVCHAPAGDPATGADVHLFGAAVAAGVFRTVWERALAVGPRPAGGWGAAVGVRLVLCTRSAWEMPYAVDCVVRDVEAARAEGRPVRDVEVVRVDGNHFVHWDRPEEAMRGLLA